MSDPELYAARPLPEDVRTHAVSRVFTHKDIRRHCGWHARLGVWTPDGLNECLLDHDEPTRTRNGDQVLPDADISVQDDQELLVQEILKRRELGIERYGQGHRPFNGRSTLGDFLDEQVDSLVYLYSIKRMSEATREDLVEAVAPLIADYVTAWAGDAESRKNKARVLAGRVVDRLMGWVVGQQMEQIMQEENRG